MQGLPLWQSSSLVGRGTFVWVVTLEVGDEESGKGSVKTFILKNAWRAQARLAESTVYKMLYSATSDPLTRIVLCSLSKEGICEQHIHDNKIHTQL